MTGFRSILLGAVSTLAVLAGSSAALAQVAEVVVLGEFVPDERRITSEISNIITPEQLQITGDSVIADSLLRITSISIQRGGFIVVRGLNERYSSVELNGSAIPSPEPLREVVPLDIFPNNFIENALVQKTFSPQYQGDFGGGVIELRSTGVPDQEFFSVGASGGYNTVSTFEKGIRQAGDENDWTGFDYDNRDLPSQLKGVDLASASSATVEAAGESIRNRWSLFNVDNDQPDWAGNFSYGNSFDVGNGSRLGILIAGNYGNEWRNRDGLRRNTTFSSETILHDDFSPDACEGLPITGCGVRNTTNTIQLNGLLSVGLEIDPSNTLTFNSIILRNTSRDGLIQQGHDDELGQIVQRNRAQWIERQAWMNQLVGSHLAQIFPQDSGLDLTTIDWRAAYSTAKRDSKDQKDFTYFYDELDDVFRISTDSSTGNKIGFGSLDDKTWDGGVDISQPFTLGNMTSVTFNFGGSYTGTERESDFLRFRFKNAPGFAANPDLREQVPEIIFGKTNIDPLGFKLENDSTTAEAFSADITTKAGYAQFDAQVTPTLRLAFGGRYESGEQNSDSFARQTIFCDAVPERDQPDRCSTGTIAFSAGDPIHIELNKNYFLPAFTGTWEFVPNNQIRAAFSKTINRPNLRELTTSPFLDPDRAEIVEGNPFLQIAELTNYDLRWEWYMEGGDFLSFGGFYKDIKNPIEQTFITIGADEHRRTFLNADKAELFGLELEFELGLPISDWIPNLGTRDFFLRGNGAYINSKATIAPSQVGVLTDSSRRLQGQSEWLGNLQFGFRDDVRGETAVLLLNYTGDRIETVGTYGRPNTVEKVPLQLDFNYTHEFSVANLGLGNVGNGTYEFSLKARNILGERSKITQGPFTIEDFEIGTTVIVGLSATY